MQSHQLNERVTYPLAACINPPLNDLRALVSTSQIDTGEEFHTQFVKTKLNFHVHFLKSVLTMHQNEYKQAYEWSSGS